MFSFSAHGSELFSPDFRRAIKLAPSPWRWGTMCNNETLMFMACLARLSPASIVEFGTFTGRCTFAMASNTEHKIYTIDCGCDNDPSNTRGYGNYIPGSDFLNTDVADRIELIIGDSREVDLSHLYGTIGLVFIDGGHSKEAVQSDTEKAFRLIRHDGIIVWDDYSTTWPEVVEAVNIYSRFSERMLHLEKDCQILYFGEKLMWNADVNFKEVKNAA